MVIPIFLISCIILLSIASTDDRECIKYAPPTPTPIPPERIYSEWIPMPGTSLGSGNGWIDARELRNYERTHRVLSDAEYAAIERAHGLPQTMGSRMGYGFPPRHNFNTLHGGVILKNEWLPKRLQ
tara:strand:- start:463 stop:840 length:378 start_codon:yes stop_codon:yes gene_type:complete